MNKATLDAIKLILKSGWKFILILIAAGIIVSGFAFQVGPFSCNKQALKSADVIPETK
jgi:hypothetical protein